MSKTNTPNFLSALFGNMGADTREEKLMTPAREGLTHQVRDYFYYNKSDFTIEDDKKHIAFDILKSPESYPAKADIVSILYDARFNTNDFFQSALIALPHIEERIWTLHAEDPSDDTAKAAGMLLAEYIKYRQVNDDETYAPDFELLVRPYGGTTDPALIEKLRQSVIATQNALVDYVVGEGPQLILNHAAAFLNMMDDVPGAEIWMKKLAGLKEGNSYSISKGDIRTMRPVFQ